MLGWYSPSFLGYFFELLTFPWNIHPDHGTDLPKETPYLDTVEQQLRANAPVPAAAAGLK